MYMVFKNGVPLLLLFFFNVFSFSFSYSYLYLAVDKLNIAEFPHQTTNDILVYIYLQVSPVVECPCGQVRSGYKG